MTAAHRTILWHVKDITRIICGHFAQMMALTLTYCCSHGQSVLHSDFTWCVCARQLARGVKSKGSNWLCGRCGHIHDVVKVVEVRDTKGSRSKRENQMEIAEYSWWERKWKTSPPLSHRDGGEQVPVKGVPCPAGTVVDEKLAEDERVMDVEENSST